jgi:hypothetical protein
MFIMTPARDGFINVWFNRGMRLATGSEIFGLQRIHAVVQKYILPRDQFYAYVDGPKHEDNLNNLGKEYDYLCTSGGFIGYKSEESGKRRWVLDGWIDTEATIALTALNYTEEQAKEAYYVCGGNFREMLKVCRNGTADTKEVLKERISRLPSQTVKLFSDSSLIDLPDMLRTMFELRDFSDYTGVWTRRMSCYQICDSQFVLDELRKKAMISLPQLFELYKVEERPSGNKAVMGVMLERIVHCWIDENKPLPVSKVLLAVGTKSKAVERLNEPNMYWYPDIPNFPNIDSALVHNGTLYVFQITIMDRHGFNETTFKNTFVDVVNKTQNQRIKRAVVYGIVPSTSTLEPWVLQFYESLIFRMNMRDLASVSDSMTRLFGEILNSTTVEQG